MGLLTKHEVKMDGCWPKSSFFDVSEPASA